MRLLFSSNRVTYEAKNYVTVFLLFWLGLILSPLPVDWSSAFLVSPKKMFTLDIPLCYVYYKVITNHPQRKQLLNDLKETRGCWKLNEEALDRTLWRTRFGRAYASVVRRTTE
jgi:hypothetical protein